MIIVLEGLNGCGKSTVAKELVRQGTVQGMDFELHRDPGSTELGERLRTILKDPAIPVDPMCQTLLFTAARRTLVPIIRAAHEKGRYVVLDRWWFSTYAYQSVEGVDPMFIVSLNIQAASLHLDPRLCFFLDVPPYTALTRRGMDMEDRFEAKGLEFQGQLRERYLELVPKWLTRVSAERPVKLNVDFVFERINSFERESS